jgi:uncharacterized membrane protein HdeD (DUF308 family)
MAMRAFRNGRGPVRLVSRSTLAWRGALAVVIGVIAVIWIAVWAAVTGFTDLFLAFGHGEAAGERLMWALTGIVSLVFAFVLAVRPIVGAITLATVFGFFSIFYGVMAITRAAQRPPAA